MVTKFRKVVDADAEQVCSIFSDALRFISAVSILTHYPQVMHF